MTTPDRHSRAHACYAYGVMSVEKAETSDPAGGLNLFMFGLNLGLALGQIDPEWAKETYEDLLERQSPGLGASEHQQKVAILQSVHELIRLAKQFEQGGPGGGD